MVTDIKMWSEDSQQCSVMHVMWVVSCSKCHHHINITWMYDHRSVTYWDLADWLGNMDQWRSRRLNNIQYPHWGLKAMNVSCQVSQLAVVKTVLTLGGMIWCCMRQSRGWWDNSYNVATLIRLRTKLIFKYVWLQTVHFTPTLLYYAIKLFINFCCQTLSYYSGCQPFHFTKSWNLKWKGVDRDRTLHKHCAWFMTDLACTVHQYTSEQVQCKGWQPEE